MTVFKGIDSDIVFQAMQLVATIRKRLEDGMCFYHPKTRKRLETVDEIMKCIQKEGSVEQRPPDTQKKG